MQRPAELPGRSPAQTKLSLFPGPGAAFPAVCLFSCPALCCVCQQRGCCWGLWLKGHFSPAALPQPPDGQVRCPQPAGKPRALGNTGNFGLYPVGGRCWGLYPPQILEWLGGKDPKVPAVPPLPWRGRLPLSRAVPAPVPSLALALPGIQWLHSYSGNSIPTVLARSSFPKSHPDLPSPPV